MCCCLGVLLVDWTIVSLSLSPSLSSVKPAALRADATHTHFGVVWEPANFGVVWEPAAGPWLRRRLRTGRARGLEWRLPVGEVALVGAAAVPWAEGRLGEPVAGAVLLGAAAPLLSVGRLCLRLFAGCST